MRKVSLQSHPIESEQYTLATTNSPTCPVPVKRAGRRKLLPASLYLKETTFKDGATEESCIVNL